MLKEHENEGLVVKAGNVGKLDPIQIGFGGIFL
jgi:hypothetical protein